MLWCSILENISNVIILYNLSIYLLLANIVVTFTWLTNWLKITSYTSTRLLMASHRKVQCSRHITTIFVNLNSPFQFSIFSSFSFFNFLHFRFLSLDYHNGQKVTNLHPILWICLVPSHRNSDKSEQCDL